MRRSGFTLIELLIVLGIAVLLGCIAITSLSRVRIASHEADAVAVLRNIAVTETSWRQNDGDGNGRPDFWTQDVSGLYRVTNASGARMELLTEDVARADGAPANSTPPGPGRPAIGPSLVTGEAKPHAGYFFRAMTTGPDGLPYQAPDADPASDGRLNPAHFGFTAWPADYGSNGRHVLVLLETGAIWARDLDGPGAGGPAPAGTTLMGNAKGGQVLWPGKPGEPDLGPPLDKPWQSVQ